MTTDQYSNATASPPRTAHFSNSEPAHPWKHPAIYLCGAVGPTLPFPCSFFPLFLMNVYSPQDSSGLLSFQKPCLDLPSLSLGSLLQPSIYTCTHLRHSTFNTTLWLPVGRECVCLPPTLGDDLVSFLSPSLRCWSPTRLKSF